MLSFSFLMLVSTTVANSHDLEVFNRSEPDYNVSTFVNTSKKSSCRVDLVKEFLSAGCSRASVRGYPGIEQFTCYDKEAHQRLADYYIIYDNGLLERMDNEVPSTVSKLSKLHCVDAAYSVFAWNIF